MATRRGLSWHSDGWPNSSDPLLRLNWHMLIISARVMSFAKDYPCDFVFQ